MFFKKKQDKKQDLSNQSANVNSNDESLSSLDILCQTDKEIAAQVKDINLLKKKKDSIYSLKESSIKEMLHSDPKSTTHASITEQYKKLNKEYQDIEEEILKKETKLAHDVSQKQIPVEQIKKTTVLPNSAIIYVDGNSNSQFKKKHKK